CTSSFTRHCAPLPVLFSLHRPLPIQANISASDRGVAKSWEAFGRSDLVQKTRGASRSAQRIMDPNRAPRRARGNRHCATWALARSDLAVSEEAVRILVAATHR